MSDNTSAKKAAGQTAGSYRILFMLLLFVSSAGIVLLGIKQKIDPFLFLKYVVWILIFQAVPLLYSGLFEERVFVFSHTKWFCVVADFVSLLLLFLTLDLKYPFWMIGGILIAMLADVKLGLVITYSLSFCAFLFQNLTENQLLFYLVIGSFLCLTAKCLIQPKNLVLTLIIIFTANITLYLLNNDLEFTGLLKRDTIFAIAVNVTIVLLVFFVGQLLLRVLPVQKMENEHDRNRDYEQDEKINTYQNMIRPEAVLIQQMKKECPALYRHSERVAVLSERAGKHIALDSQLCLAGGWYHEIGRLNGQDYIEEGVKLVALHQLPIEIEDIIRQHHNGEEFPKSKEAAIITICDNLLTTFDYLKANQKKDISTDRVIDNIFGLQLKKGRLDQCGLSISDYNKLRQFFLLVFTSPRKSQVSSIESDVALS